MKRKKVLLVDIAVLECCCKLVLPPVLVHFGMIAWVHSGSFVWGHLGIVLLVQTYIVDFPLVWEHFDSFVWEPVGNFA